MITHTYIGDAVISTSDLVAIAALKMLNWTEGGINAGRQDMLPPDTPTAMADAIVSLRAAQCEFDFCLDARRQVKPDPYANAINSGIGASINQYNRAYELYIQQREKKKKKKGLLGSFL